MKSCRGHRLYLATEPGLRIGVDPGQEASSTPLLLIPQVGIEPATEGETLRLEASQSRPPLATRLSAMAMLRASTVTGPSVSICPRTTSAAATSGSMASAANRPGRVTAGW